MTSFKLDTPPKQIADDPSFEVNSCIFCSKHFDLDNRSTPVDISKLDKLFKACQLREDDIGKCILSNVSNIKEGTVSLNYHKKCRPTTKAHIMWKE